MLAAAAKLRAAGVLGLNERNSDFIMRHNPRRLYPRVDDKVMTKELALKAGMAVPDLYGVIANQGEVRTFSKIVEKLESEDSLRELLDHEIDYGQGFLFGEPRPARPAA